MKQHRDLVIIIVLLFMVMGIAALFNHSSINLTGAVVGVEDVEVQQEVLDTVAEEGIADVIVVLKDTSQTTSTDIEIRQDAIAEQQQEVLSDLSSEEHKTIFGVQEKEFTVDEKFTTLNAFAGEVTSSGLDELLADPNVEAIIPNGIKTLFLADSIPLIQASSAWNITVNSQNIDGTGQTVCVIDTGVDYTHDAFGNCDTASFLAGTCSKVIAGYDFAYDDNDPIDDHDHGHGTHIAGIIASTDTTYRGVAPGARIAAVKVCTNTGSCADADVIAGIDWCVSHAQQYNITVISMSLGGNQFPSYCDNSTIEEPTAPLYAASINQAVAQNITMVIATGNGNSNVAAGVALPACIEQATRVSATTKSDQIATYAFRNSNFTDILLAPGSFITSFSRGGGTTTYSGTSMAAPHVAAAVALLQQFSMLQYDSFLTPQQVTERLATTGKNISDPLTAGIFYPRIDLYQAILSIDTIIPEITFTGLTPIENSTVTNSVTISVNSSKPLRHAILEWNNVNETMEGSGTSFSITKSLSGGYYSIKVNGIYLPQQTGETEKRIFWVDAISNPGNNSFQNTAFRINATITSTENLSSVAVLVINSSNDVLINNTQMSTERTESRTDLINISLPKFTDGSYTLMVIARIINNETYLFNHSFIVDTTTPSITAITRTPEIIHNNDSVLFTITVNDLSLNNSLVFLETNASGNWTSYPMNLQNETIFNYTLTGRSNLSIGKQIGYRFSAADLAGNQYVTETFYFTVENRVPSVVITAPTTNTVLEISELNSFTAQGLDADNETLTYTWNYGLGDLAFGQTQSYSYNRTGSFNVSVTINDNLNQSSAIISLTVVDTKAPTISTSSYDTEVHLQQDTNLPVTAAAADPSGISLFNLTITGIAQHGSCSSTNVSRSCSWIVNNLSIGSYSFVLNSTDTTGHSNFTTSAFTVTSCSDGVQNGNEEGVDCSGACSTACSSDSSTSSASSSGSSSSGGESSSTEENMEETVFDEPVPEDIPEESIPTATEDIENQDTTILAEETLAATENETQTSSTSITGFFSALVPGKMNGYTYGLIGLISLILILGSLYWFFGRKEEQEE